MTVTEITTAEQLEKIIARATVVFVDFSAPWCGPCRFISPIYEKVAQEYANEDVQFCKLNIDEVRDVAQVKTIGSIPTFFVYKKGEKIKEMSSASESALRDL